MGLFAQLPVLPLGLINEIIVLTIFSSTSMRLTYLKVAEAMHDFQWQGQLCSVHVSST